MKIPLTGVGAASNPFALRDRNGTGALPIQVDIEGTATYRINGRVSDDAGWQEITPPSSEGILESISWIPFVQLEVISGTGKVSLWVAET